MQLRLAGGQPVTLVAVAAILVAGIRLHFLDLPVDGRGRNWTRRLRDVQLAKGQEMGWFEHGSTIVVLTPDGFGLCENLATGTAIRMGAPLLRLPAGAAPAQSRSP
jgi:phosphatidylserine decarboxylase